MNTEEYFLSKEEAETAFQNLVASGCIKLCIHHKVANKDKVLKLSVNTPRECELLSKVIQEAQPVFVNDIYTGWYLYPNQLDSFSPTIARAEIKYYWGNVATRMGWNRSS